LEASRFRPGLPLLAGGLPLPTRLSAPGRAFRPAPITPLIGSFRTR